jgi:signal transduction histidine kinase
MFFGLLSGRRLTGDHNRGDASDPMSDGCTRTSSMSDAGTLAISPERFEVRRLVHELVESVSPLIQERNNNLTVTGADDVGMMFGDQTKIAQILINLLDNAAKFTRNGWISVDVRRLTVRGRATIQFSVGDTGVGMTRQQTEKIFVPAPATAKRTGGRTGPGLATVLRFCDLMSGTVSVESHPGHGTTFFVHLPADVPLVNVRVADEDESSAPPSMARTA